MTNTKKYPYKQIHKPMLALLMCASSISVHAAIISDNSERRIQVRQGSSSNAHIRPSTNNTSYNSGVTMLSGDSMQGLIAQKQLDFDFDDSLSIEENKRMNVNRRAPAYNTTYSNNSYSTANNTYNSTYTDSISMDFNAWLNSNSYRARQVADFQRYLNSRVAHKMYRLCRSCSQQHEAGANVVMSLISCHRRSYGQISSQHYVCMAN